MGRSLTGVLDSSFSFLELTEQDDVAASERRWLKYLNRGARHEEAIY